MVTPIVEGGAPLTPHLSVYLAVTPGQVTQTPITQPGAVSIRLGEAVSTTSFVLATDALFQFGG